MFYFHDPERSSSLTKTGRANNAAGCVGSRNGGHHDLRPSENRRRGHRSEQSEVTRYPRWVGVLFGEGPKDLHLDATVRQPFFLATLAVDGKVRRLAVEVQGRVVNVHLVEQEQLGVLG